MSERGQGRVTGGTRIGEDVDLEQDDVRLADGTRLTQDVAEQIVDRARRGGRPSLSGRTQTSPQIAFRVPKEVRDKALEVAARQHKSLSQLAREALENLLEAS